MIHKTEVYIVTAVRNDGKIPRDIFLTVLDGIWYGWSTSLKDAHLFSRLDDASEAMTISKKKHVQPLAYSINNTAIKVCKLSVDMESVPKERKKWPTENITP